jgi:putative ABC transport system permease protein
MRHLIRRVSFPRLIEHPLRTFLTVLGIALGVASSISVQMITDTMSDSFSSMIDAVSGKAALQISGGEIGVAEELYDRLQARDENNRPPIRGLHAAMPTIQTVTKFAAENLLVLAVDTLNDRAARDYKMVGKDGAEISDPLAFLNSTNAILLNRDFAGRHHFNIDDTIELLTSKGLKPFVIRGLLESSGPATAFGGNFALMDVYAAQIYFGKAGLFDSIDLLLEPGADVNEVRQNAEAFLGGRYEVRRPEQRNEGVDSLLRSLKMGLVLMMLIVLAMGGFIIFHTVTTSIYQRTREIGILRMVGVTRSGIWSLFVFEGVWLGLAGSILGTIGGYFLGRYSILEYAGAVTNLFVPTDTTHAVFKFSMIIKGTILGLGATMLGAMYPSWRATSITPLQVLRFGPGLSAGKGAKLLRWTALALASAVVIAACVFHPALRLTLNGVRTAMFSILIAGIAMTPIAMYFFLRLFVRLTAVMRTPLVRLASENLLRDLGRSAMTVAAFMVALAVMFEIYIFMNSMKKEIRSWMDNILKADVFITASGTFATRISMAMDPSMTKKIAELPGVEDAVELRSRQVDWGDVRIVVIAVNLPGYLNRTRIQFVREYDEEAVQASVRDEGVFISQNFAARNPELRAGGMLTLMTPEGKVDFKILGIIVDFTSETGSVLINHNLYKKYFKDELVDTYYVYLKPGVDTQSIRRAVDSMVGENFHLFVLTNREFKDSILSAIDQIFSLSVSLEILTLIIAIIGIINNLLANVIDRTREIGVLRSLGATRMQIGLIFCLQSGIMGFCGAFVALFAGWGLGTIHMKRLSLILSGWVMPIHYSAMLIAVTFLVVVLTATVSGLFPATRAAGLKLREALKYE